MPPLTRVALIAHLWVGGVAAAATVGPTLTLPEADRIVIETSLGPGRLGPPLPAVAIDAPAHGFPAHAGTQLFTITQGADAGTQQAVIWTSAPKPATGGTYRFGTEEELRLRTERDGSAVIEGVEDLQADSVTRYDPPEPFLLNGMFPGETRQTRMLVKVFSRQDPKTVTHQGELQVTHDYLGAFRLSVPAGTFDSLVTKSIIKGTVGPATIEDVQYRFFAPQVGLIATIENRQVSALLVYQSHSATARVLSQAAR